jgi:hypothetical protein
MKKKQGNSSERSGIIKDKARVALVLSDAQATPREHRVVLLQFANGVQRRLPTRAVRKRWLSIGENMGGLRLWSLKSSGEVARSRALQVGRQWIQGIQAETTAPALLRSTCRRLTLAEITLIHLSNITKISPFISDKV